MQYFVICSDSTYCKGLLCPHLVSHDPIQIFKPYPCKCTDHFHYCKSVHVFVLCKPHISAQKEAVRV